MAQLFGRDAGHKAVKRLQLRFAAKIEALIHVIIEGRHLAILTTQQFLQRGGGVRIGFLGRRQLGLKLVYAHKHRVKLL